MVLYKKETKTLGLKFLQEVRTVLTNNQRSNDLKHKREVSVAERRRHMKSWEQEAHTQKGITPHHFLYRINVYQINFMK